MGRRKLIAFVLILALSASCVWAVPMKQKVNLHGGRFPTKSMALWELHRFKDVDLLRMSPLSWCPFKSYLAVDAHVKVENANNKNWLVIDTDLVDIVKADASYNKAHAKVYKGKPKTRLKKIFRYCARTEYVAHVKFARNVFEERKGDCAGIASAFYVLCKKNKIPVRYVIGWAYGECHAWNRVKLGKKWYWIDPTLEQWISRKQLEGDRTVMEMW